MSKYLLTPLLAFTVVITLVMLASNNTNDSAVKNAEAAYLGTNGIVYFGNGIINPSCFDNYTTWNNSTVYNPNAPWSTAFLPPMKSGSSSSAAYEAHSQFLDVNGDGLNDFLFSQRFPNVEYGVKYNHGYDCLYLNKGNGWEKAYRCVAEAANGQIRYYGDCAG